MQWEFFGALFGVIGVGWLTIVPIYRGWEPLQRQMARRVRITIATLEGESGGREQSPRSR